MRRAVCKHTGGEYAITVGEKLLQRADEFFDLQRKTLIVTDTGVPFSYAETVASRAKESKIVLLPQGESTKSFSFLERLCKEALDFEMTRRDCIVAVGGGVIGDLTGFAASMYMRGVDFYNVPTTLLSQVDSSVGGKTAIDFCGVKNPVGAFYPPKGVLIDTDVLKTLSKRQISCGLAEAAKMAVTLDKDLFCFMEREEITDRNLQEIIFRAVKNKIAVVEQDEKEGNLRKVLNFGHTLGHAIESADGRFLHGECVATGSLAFCSDSVYPRLKKLLEKYDLPVCYDGDKRGLLELVKHDKKSVVGGVDGVFCDEVGSFRIEKISFEKLAALIEKL